MRSVSIRETLNEARFQEIAVGLAVVTAALALHPSAAAIAVIAVLVGVVATWVTRAQNRKYRALLAERLAEDGREGAGICRFARHFPRRAHDTRIIRAVYEEMETICTLDTGPKFPVRATDKVYDIVHDDDDFDLDALSALETRCGRDFSGWNANPLVKQAETVADLVRLIDSLPPKAT